MLRSISVPIISNQRCTAIYSSLGPRAIEENNFCTLHPKRKKSSCIGDKGGPFVVNGKLYGVLTSSLLTQTVVEPDVFVKLSLPMYTQWILSNLRQAPRA